MAHHDLKLDLARALDPLLAAAVQGRFLRMVVRPGHVMADLPAGEAQELDVVWLPEQHEAVLQVLTQPVRLASGVAVLAVGETVILKPPPNTTWRADDLSHQGWVSPLAARLLTAALSLGRNILMTGPWALSTQVIAALVNEGQRPALLGSAADALPRRWVQVRNAADAQSVGADRIAAWSLAPDDVVRAMGQLSGVMAWSDGRRLDRALMRFELGAEMASRRTHTPLHVLAGLDLVVVAGLEGGPRVREIAEITLMDEGYRPNFLFVSGRAPAPTALMPVAAPSFVEELAAAGHTVLADELRHVGGSGARPGAAGAVGAAGAPSPRLMRANYPPEAPAEPPLERRAAKPKVSIEQLPDTDSTPGWELDRLPPPTPTHEARHSSSVGLGARPASNLSNAEEAAMAAAYGLGPPPRPSGANVFAEVLRHTQAGPDTTGNGGAGNDNAMGIDATVPENIDPEDVIPPAKKS